MSADIKIKQAKCAIAFLASGMGLLGLSISHMLADITGGAGGPVGKALTFHTGIGPFSGKQIVGLITWFLAWFILSKIFSGQEVQERTFIIWTVILYALATLLVFPPFLSLL